MKLAGLLVMAGFIFAGCPNHEAEQERHFSKGLRCESFKDEKTCPTSCHWDGKTCLAAASPVAEAKCAELLDETSCGKARTDGKKCHWQKGQPSCHLNPKAQCTLSKHERKFKEDPEPTQYCCAGADTTCVRDNDNCASREEDGLKRCFVRPKAQCVLNWANTDEHRTEGRHSAQYCCSGNRIDCFYHNSTCEYKVSQGSCAEEPVERGHP